MNVEKCVADWKNDISTDIATPLLEKKIPHIGKNLSVFLFHKQFIL